MKGVCVCVRSGKIFKLRYPKNTHNQTSGSLDVGIIFLLWTKHFCNL